MLLLSKFNVAFLIIDTLVCSSKFIIIVRVEFRNHYLIKNGALPKSLTSRVVNLTNFQIMLKKIKTVAAAALVAGVMSSCALTLPVNATSNAVGSKVGRAQANGFFTVLFFNQDASIQRAAKNGGITKISTVDLKATNILGIITNFETIVTGE